MWNEFRQFIMRGNVLDLAVGVIIGGAFGKIVSSLVNDLLMPLLGLLLGKIDLSAMSYVSGETVIKYGSFLQSIIDFLIISFSIFVFIYILNSRKRKAEKEKEREKAEQPPVRTSEEVLLEEIRDLLKDSVEK
jgi:large conductance mechanosensitive channel